MNNDGGLRNHTINGLLASLLLLAISFANTDITPLSSSDLVEFIKSMLLILATISPTVTPA